MKSQTTHLPYSLPTVFMLVFTCLFMAGVLVSGCDSGGSDDEESLAGTYTLVRYEGQTLPYSISTDAILTQGRLTLNEGGTFQGTAIVDAGESGQFTAEGSGSYTVADGMIQFSLNDIDPGGAAGFVGDPSGIGVTSGIMEDGRLLITYQYGETTYRMAVEEN